jgi:hypothetical protein
MLILGSWLHIPLRKSEPKNCACVQNLGSHSTETLRTREIVDIEMLGSDTSENLKRWNLADIGILGSHSAGGTGYVSVMLFRVVLCGQKTFCMIIPLARSEPPRILISALSGKEVWCRVDKKLYWRVREVIAPIRNTIPVIQLVASNFDDLGISDPLACNF